MYGSARADGKSVWPPCGPHLIGRVRNLLQLWNRFGNPKRQRCEPYQPSPQGWAILTRGMRAEGARHMTMTRL